MYNLRTSSFGLLLACLLTAFGPAARGQLILDWVRTDSLNASYVVVDSTGDAYLHGYSLVLKYSSGGDREWAAAPDRFPGGVTYVHAHQFFASDREGNSYLLYEGTDEGAGFVNCRMVSYNSNGVLRYDQIHHLYSIEERNLYNWQHSLWGLAADHLGYAYVSGWDGCNYPYQDCSREGFVLTFNPAGAALENRYDSPFEKTSSASSYLGVGRQGHVRGFGHCYADVLECPSPDGDDTSHVPVEGILLSGAYGGSFTGWTVDAFSSCVCAGGGDSCDVSWGGIYHRPLVDAAGNFIMISAYHDYAQPGMVGMIRKYASGGSVIYSVDLPYSDIPENCVMGPSDDFYGTVHGNLVKYDGASGSLLWSAPADTFFVVLETGDVYTFDAEERVTCYDGDTGAQKWQYDPGTDLFPSWRGVCLAVDHRNNLYVAGSDAGYRLVLARYQATKQFEFLDGTTDHDPVAETEFELFAADPAEPGFVTEHLGTYSSNDAGMLSFDLSAQGELMSEGEGTGLSIGDYGIFCKRADLRLAVKHPSVLSTMYSVWLDAIKFDENGQVVLESIDEQATQALIFDHTEYRYNLLVSIEWDADEVYLTGLRADLRLMSNFLYDVTDGQVRLDTVVIVDNKWYWEDADMRICATNMLRPNAFPLGIQYPGPYPITMPRKWFGDTTSQPDQTYLYHPLDMAVSNNYTTMTHEFGHYALGFYDEYLFVDAALAPLPSTERCEPRPNGNYGFMDFQYDLPPGGVYSSEMSSKYRYTNPDCRNTHQWMYWGGLSCWDSFENWAEGEFGGIYVPILKPDLEDGDERLPPTGLDYIPGPNDDETAPDYDVGSLLQIIEPPLPPTVPNQSLHVEVHGAAAGGVYVVLWKHDPIGGLVRSIDQGKTARTGRIWVLGANLSYDWILASGLGWRVVPAVGAAAAGTERSWFVAQVELGAGLARLGSGFQASAAGDSVEITLQEVSGDYPLLCAATLTGGSMTYTLQYTGAALPSLPALDVQSPGGSSPATFTAVASGYTAPVADSLGESGRLYVWAEDSVGADFFFTNEYVLTTIGASDQLQKLIGPGGGVVFHLDTLNSDIDSVLIVSSPYLVPLDGLDPDVVQAGMAHSLAVHPASGLVGSNSVTIMYEDSDLDAGSGYYGLESTLKIFRWSVGAAQWELVGGEVDTAFNQVIAAITGPGTYAAFTTDIVLGVEDDPRGETLPLDFELQQNYPNPFNPTTTISYSLPEAAHVRIEVYNVIGQRVKSLVNSTQPAGKYEARWDGTDESGNPVASGVYLYRFQSGGQVVTRKMLLLR